MARIHFGPTTLLNVLSFSWQPLRELFQLVTSSHHSRKIFDRLTDTREPRWFAEAPVEGKSSTARRSYLVAPILVTPPPSFVTQTLLPSNATMSGLNPTA